MKYGLVGEHLSHSFSKSIHSSLADYEYGLCEVSPDDFAAFIAERDFLGINLTIPYKETVIPLLDHIDENAKAIGAVNTVVNIDGELYGFNTDFYGMKLLFEHAEIDVSGKKAAILGSGGTSKTARAVLNALGAREILTVSRSSKENTITYDELISSHTDIEILVNTTPVGMYPEVTLCPVDITPFNSLCGVIDAVYNPLRSALVVDAQNRGIRAEGGLYMLVAQALRASEIFLSKEYPEGTLKRVYDKIRRDKENIVLIGMPSSGKSTVGEILAKRLGRRFVDTDEAICDIIKSSISRFFKEQGEEAFRLIESEVILSHRKDSSLVIATGGGSVLREENLSALRNNGVIIFIDRSKDKLEPTDSRPLSSNPEAMEKLYYKRHPIYCRVCDVRIDADEDAETVADKILEIF